MRARQRDGATIVAQAMDPFLLEAEMSVQDSRSPSPPTHRPHNSWAVGLSLFAGIVMIIGGVFNAMEGIVALLRNESTSPLPATSSRLT